MLCMAEGCDEIVLELLTMVSVVIDKLFMVEEVVFVVMFVVEVVGEQ